MTTFSERLKQLVLRFYRYIGLSPKRDLLPIPPQIRIQDSKIRYLENEVSELRELIRYLLPASAEYQRMIAETYASFDYQFRRLDQGAGLLSDPDFQRDALSLLEQCTGLPPAWFAGKKILDAGCGNGRWSHVLSLCKAEVTAIDHSASGVEATQAACKNFPGFQARRHSILDPLNMPGAFDMVWSFGVTHHTGNTRQAVTNIAECVRAGGYLFLMIYGEPRWDHFEDYDEINDYTAMRRALASLEFDERVAYLQRLKTERDVHGWFDAASPRINDLHRFDEVAEWLRRLKFTDIRLTVPSRNLHIMARRP